MKTEPGAVATALKVEQIHESDPEAGKILPTSNSTLKEPIYDFTSPGVH
jgi:hypothetical protein